MPRHAPTHASTGGPWPPLSGRKTNKRKHARKNPAVAKNSTSPAVFMALPRSPMERRNRRRGATRLLLQKRPLLQLLKRLLKLLLRVHHDRSVPGDRLLKRLARNQQEANPFVSGLNADLVATVEQDERAIVGFPRRRRVEPADRFRRHREGSGRIAELARAREDVRERVARCLDWQRLPFAGAHRHVEIDRIGRDSVHWASLAPEGAADDADMGAVIVDDLWDFSGLYFLIARLRHLERRRQVGP